MAQYLKPDCELGYVEDNAEIECLKFNNLRHVVLGCMLGDFDEVGTYVVSPEIVKELIGMEKYLINTYENVEFCKGFLKLDKQISFMVTFEGNRAILSLIEKLNYEANFALNSGTYSNINEYVLDVVETSGEVNRNAIYMLWNIKTTQGQVVDIFNCDDAVLEKYFGIVNRFKYLLEANKILLKKEEAVEEIEAEYANNVLDILAHYPKLKKVVIKTINETLNEKKDAVSVKKPYFAKTINEILENAIENNIDVLDENEKEEFLKEKRNAVVALNIKREDALEVEHVNDNENEKDVAPSRIVVRVPVETESRKIDEVAADYVREVTQVNDRLTGETKSGAGVAQSDFGLDLIGRLTQRIIENGNEARGTQPREGKPFVGSNKSRLIKNLEDNGISRTLLGIAPVVTANNNTQTQVQTGTTTPNARVDQTKKKTAVPVKTKPASQGRSASSGSSSSGSKGGSSNKPQTTKPKKIVATSPARTTTVATKRYLYPAKDMTGARTTVSAKEVDIEMLDSLSQIRDGVNATESAQMGSHSGRVRVRDTSLLRVRGTVAARNTNQTIRSGARTLSEEITKILTSETSLEESVERVKVSAPSLDEELTTVLEVDNSKATGEVKNEKEDVSQFDLTNI